jgi:hypothetical protein
MHPLKQIAFSLPAGTEFSLLDGSRRESCEDDASVTSEISIDFIAKEQEKDRKNRSSSSGWNPDGSDYSLNVLLSSKDDSCPSLSDSATESLLGSDYSLNVRLSTSKASLDSDCPSSSALKQAKTRKPQDSRTASKVKFYSRVRIQRVTNRKDLPKDQIESVWYSRDEFKAIRRDCFDTIKLMTENGALLDDEALTLGRCSRGLEYKTKTAYKERQKNKIEIRNVIFEEQGFQRENGMEDRAYLAQLSREQSLSCVGAAIITAKRDELAARRYLSC